MRPPARLALTALLAVAAVGCANDGPPAAGSDGATTTTTTTEPPATTLAPEPTDPTAPRPLLANADGANDRLRGVAQVEGLGSHCTGFAIDAGSLDGPATVMTNGHCVGIFDATTVIFDDPAPEGARVTFGRFADVPDGEVEVPVTRVRYGTMRSTDVAILELGMTRAELVEREIPSYGLTVSPPPGLGIEAVGVPVTGVPDDAWFLRRSACEAADMSRLVEWEWLWDEAVASNCGGILGGNSGSPVFVAGEYAAVVGIVNTTTIGSGPGACYLGQPCEVGLDGAAERADTSYFMSIGDWEACWVPDFDPAADGCPAEAGPHVNVDAPRRAVPSDSTWAATVSVVDGAGDDEVATKDGPVASTDCRDTEGYGEPVEVDDVLGVDESVGDDEGVVVLCAAVVVDDEILVRTAGYAVMDVDDTPPDVEIRLSVNDFGGDLSVEPIFSPPELSSFMLKVGPAGSTDCDDEDDYRIYRRVAVPVPADEQPATMCVVGEDEAGNRGDPQSFELP